jgi:hypothetical protein
MDSQEFLNVAIGLADARGRFDPRKLSRQLKISKVGLGEIGRDLEMRRLVVTSVDDVWQLSGVAQELAHALHVRNIDRAPMQTRFNGTRERIEGEAEPKV